MPNTRVLLLDESARREAVCLLLLDCDSFHRDETNDNGRNGKVDIPEEQRSWMDVAALVDESVTMTTH